jgi:DNA-binding MarR family transcriptional regulator
MAMIGNPSDNDRKLAGRTRINISTVTALKNRLRRDKLIKRIRIPAAGRIGGELIGMAILKLDPFTDRSQATKALRKGLGGMDCIFWAFNDLQKAVAMGCYPNFTALDSDFNRLDGIPGIKDRESRIFPLEHCTIDSFFDFGTTFAYLFSLTTPIQYKGTKAGKPAKVITAQAPALRWSGQRRRLKNIEKRVLTGLIKYAGSKDINVGKRIGVTRQTVTKIRNRFLKEGLFTDLTLPDLQRYGMKILALWDAPPHYVQGEEAAGKPARHGRPSVKSPAKDAEPWVVGLPPRFIDIRDERQRVALSLFPDFSSATSAQLRMELETGGRVKMHLFSLDHLEILKDVDFEPAVKLFLAPPGAGN